MRAIHVLLAACLGLPACSERDNSGLPRLAIDNDPAVCSAFFQAVKTSFDGPDYKVSATRRPWPVADFEPVLSIPREPDHDRDPSEPVIKRVELDLDGDGRKQLLVLQASPFGWRGDTYTLVRYPSAEAFDTLPPSERPQGLGSGTDLMPRGTAGDNEQPSWSWNPPSVVRLGKAYFVLWQGEPYQDAPPTLYRISAEGAPSIACQVQIMADEKAPLGALEGTAVARLYEQLVAMAGSSEYEKCGGSMNALGRVVNEAELTRWRLAERPWALGEGYNPRPRVDDWLAAWASESLRNYRTWRAFKAVEPEALAVLGDYYQRKFGFADSTAQAQRALDRVIANHFVFPANSRGYLGPGSSDLGWALLQGRSDELPRLIRDVKQSRSADDRRLFERSPLLALEHPASLRLLLDAGAPVEAQEPYGKTALMYAAQFDLVDAARLLLDRGADVNAATRVLTSEDDDYCDAPTIGNRTALHYAAAEGSLAMIRLLVGRGADLAAKRSDGRTPFELLKYNAKLSKPERETAGALLTR